jgi:UDP-N-acetyl-D-glucosamine dehydrogenase
VTSNEPANQTNNAPHPSTVRDGDPNAKPRVGIVGIGYTGLPLAVGFAAAGASVVCFDVDRDKVSSVNRSQSYLGDVSDDHLAAVAGRLIATSNPQALATTDAVVICVPTPATAEGEPDLRYVHSAIDSLATRVRPGMLVVLQSTVPPGTTRAIARRLARRSGLRAGVDVLVACVPERIDPANKGGWTLRDTPKLVGGLNEASTAAAKALFELVCDRVVPVSSAEVAETAKVFENTFRMVNIALTYELSDLCAGLDISVREVIMAAATKPYGFLPHYPGPGVGGECIAVDPLFLRAVARRTEAHLPVLNAAYLCLISRPTRVVDRLEQVMREELGYDLAGSRVLVVGVSYKPEVADTRNAPAIEVIRELRRRDAKPSYSDPLVDELTIDGETVPRVEWERPAVAAFDCLVLITPHESIMKNPLWTSAPVLLDTWNQLIPGDGVAHL